jgi:hypothetical protein
MLEWQIIGAFQLYADGEVVAALPATPVGRSGMPRAPCAGYELNQFAVAPYQEMCGNSDGGDFAKIGVPVRIKLVREEIENARSTEFARRQTDVMDYQQFHRASRRTFIGILRGDEPRTFNQTRTVDVHSAPA